MEYSGAGGKLIHEKNQKQKISWHCPLKFGHKTFSLTGWQADSIDQERDSVERLFT